MQKFRLTWNDKRHCLGIASIDSQHRGLVELVNELLEAMEQGCDHEQARRHMNNLLRFTSSHFAHEEEMMQKHGFPGLERHAAEHARLLQDAATMVEALTPDNPGRAVLITAFLTDCVEYHIQEEDVALVHHLRGKGLS
jgi:hemerythrin-like metal-binding protein